VQVMTSASVFAPREMVKVPAIGKEFIWISRVRGIIALLQAWKLHGASVY
jgi:hypothetical protein